MTHCIARRVWAETPVGQTGLGAAQGRVRARGRSSHNNRTRNVCLIAMSKFSKTPGIFTLMSSRTYRYRTLQVSPMASFQGRHGLFWKRWTRRCALWIAQWIVQGGRQRRLEGHGMVGLKHVGALVGRLWGSSPCAVMGGVQDVERRRESRLGPGCDTRTGTSRGTHWGGLWGPSGRGGCTALQRCA